MERLPKIAVVLHLIDSLRGSGSWTGETHVQKSMYCLQEITGVPTDFEFIIYKHGPFSFDLRAELTAMRADGLLKVETNSYGSSLSSTALGKALCARFPKTIQRYTAKMDYIAKSIGSKGVVELERLATALYVTKEMEAEDIHQRALLINKIKPHISIAQATDAVTAIDQMIGQAALSVEA